MQFGDRLKALRKERKMTQRDLADCLNISDRVVGYYESNERFPKGAHTLTSIANVFNVSLDYLLGQELPDRFSYSELLEIARVHFRLATPEQQRVIFDDITNIYYECWALNKEKQAL
ncbi:MAG: helix-turn-helix transcriptional regulator [Cellulosilyticaceae bacterium]